MENKQELADQIYQKYFPTSNGKTFGMYEKKSVLAAIIEAMDSLPTIEWVKASERLPESIKDKIFRQISSKILLSISMAKDWIEDESIDDLEWLDEPKVDNL
jgi:hypothetical protein